MAGIPKVRVQFDADFDQLKKGVKGATNEVESFGSKVGDFSKKAGQAFALVGAAAAVMAVKIGIDSIKAASDLGETISKVGVLFGDSAKEIEKFADGAAQSLGQTKQQALDAAANFAIFGSSAGLAGEDLVKFSTDFVSLAGDLASFNNVSQDEAINAIGSALRGEAEPLRRFGVLLDAATLEAAAFSLGIYDGSGALTAQQKVLAAQKVIFEQTTTAQGDFERTSEGLANKIKNAITKNNDELEPFFNLIKGIAEFAVKYLAPAISEVLGAAFKVLGGIISGIVTVFAKLVSGITATINAVKALASALANSVVGKAVSGIASGIGSVFGGGRAQGGSVTGGTPYLVGERGAELFVPQSSGSIVPNSSLGGGTTINLTVNGAIDSEGAARQIIALLNNSYYRGTSGAGALVT
jgi:phage-related protein